MGKPARDLLLFFAFCALPVASFLLVDYPETQFYLSLLLISLVVIVWLRQYYKEPDQLVDYDENLSLYSLVLVGGGVVGIVAVASLFVSAFAESLIYVPMHNLGMAFGQLQLSGYWNDVLFQIVLVAPAEECVKLVVHLSFFIWLKAFLDRGLARTVAIVGPIGFWALLHTYRNPSYMGTNMWVMVGAAFLGGLIIFAVMHYCKSLLAAVLTHALYNCVVIYSAYYGLFG